MQPTERATRPHPPTLVLVAAAIGAIVVAPLLVAPLRAQEGMSAESPSPCEQWEVATFAPNTDDTQPEFLPLGLPRPFDPQSAILPPRNPEDAAFLLPEGWEPVGLGPTANLIGETVVLARRCAR